jgi:hypothetical protein
LADRALRENPRMTAVVNFKVAACGYLGRFKEGRECMKRLNELLPGSRPMSEDAMRRSCHPKFALFFAEGVSQGRLTRRMTATRRLAAILTADVAGCSG